jgi:hypothetical protein
MKQLDPVDVHGCDFRTSQRPTISVMSNPAPSSHPRGEPQPVNPYAASRVPDPDASSRDRPVASETIDRQYQARMDWSDRRLFLLAVGPTRISAVCGVLIWLKSTYELVRMWCEFLAVNRLEYWDDFVLLGLALVVLLQGIVGLYACLVEWRYADRLGEVAGGTTANMAEWSRLHLRATWLFAAIAALGLASTIGYWLLDQAAAQRLFPV